MTLECAARFGVVKLHRTGLSIVIVCFASLLGSAQDLAPRAYLITPKHSNAVTLNYAYSTGDLLLDGSLPLTGAKATFNISVFNYTHSLNLLGRSANFSASLPYGVGNFRGTVVGAETNAYRSGALDSSYRLSVNLKGGPAMDLKEFRGWQQKTLLGVSLKVVASTGQYDPTKLINYGANRWALSPSLVCLNAGDIGYSTRTEQAGSSP